MNNTVRKLFDFALKDRAPYGSDVAAGTYECVDCGHEITVQSVTSLPPCPKFNDSHTKKEWKCLSGRGDAKNDPQRKTA